VTINGTNQRRINVTDHPSTLPTRPAAHAGGLKDSLPGMAAVLQVAASRQVAKQSN